MHAFSHLVLVAEVYVIFNYPRIENMLQVVLPKVLTAQDPEGFREGVVLPQIPHGRDRVNLVAELIDGIQELVLGNPAGG